MFTGVPITLSESKHDITMQVADNVFSKAFDKFNNNHDETFVWQIKYSFYSKRRYLVEL